MFNRCNSLRTVDISGINASIGFYDCFLGSGELTKIINNLGTVSATLISDIIMEPTSYIQIQ